MNSGMDINVTGVWEHNITGQGVTVVVVDDGVQHTHKDIQLNYVSPNVVSTLNSTETKPVGGFLGSRLCLCAADGTEKKGLEMQLKVIFHLLNDSKDVGSWR